ncbi:DNA internalization-related competence protein ComEC/Rec2 [Butyrivibrio sp. MC2013]|uniref:DNA internalization-related competence protein ComEC/Rec2 n=1 Tax=Butyrivibrio sp. MC2013 TaxID=1280686 RepID=UPI00040BF972|nr:DNA internalization-related competence protein ComEC/Rec2 [Butyrivibrio sp. MC2013]
MEKGSVITTEGYVSKVEYRDTAYGTGIAVIRIAAGTNADLGAEVYLQEGSKVPDIGEYISVRGSYAPFAAATNPGEFDSRSYYEILKTEYRIYDGQITGSRGGRDIVRQYLARLRLRSSKALDRSLDKEDASVMKAMLLADRASMDAEIKDLYQDMGIIHILSISGLHISILGMGLYRLLKRIYIPGSAARLMALTLTLSYCMMCGMGAGAVRALIMFILALMAEILERTYDMLTAISLAAILLIISQPMYIYHSGFLLSFGAVLGIALILPLIPELPDTYPLFIKRSMDTIRAGMAILLMTLPVQMNYYYTYPIYSILLNILVLPFVAILLILGISIILMDFVLEGFGGFAGIGATMILGYYKELCLLFRKLPGSTAYLGRADIRQIVIYYVLLAVFIIVRRHILTTEPARSRKKRPVQLYGPWALPLLAVIILSIRLRPDFRLTFLDVGQGSGIVVEAGGDTILVDQGSSSRDGIGGYVTEPYLKYRGIGYVDAAIVTHEDADHYSGILELLQGMERGGIRIGRLVLPDCAQSSRTEDYRELEATAGRAGVAISYIKRGDHFTIGRSSSPVDINCLGPVKGMISDEANAHSVILHLSYKNQSCMLTGDVEKEGLEELKDYLRTEGQAYGDVDILQAPHHGSRYSSDEELLDILSPDVTVISAGRNNSYGHPHKETLEMLSSVGSSYYITYEMGAVTIDGDGEIAFGR